MKLCGGSALVELGPAAPGRALLAGGDHEAGGGEHLAPEVGRVQLDAPDGLVDAAQVGDRERLLQQGGGQAGVLQLGAGPLDRVGEDPAVVEGEAGSPSRSATGQNRASAASDAGGRAW